MKTEKTYKPLSGFRPQLQCPSRKANLNFTSVVPSNSPAGWMTRLTEKDLFWSMTTTPVFRARSMVCPTWCGILCLTFGHESWIVFRSVFNFWKRFRSWMLPWRMDRFRWNSISLNAKCWKKKWMCWSALFFLSNHSIVSWMMRLPSKSTSFSGSCQMLTSWRCAISEPCSITKKID